MGCFKDSIQCSLQTGHWRDTWEHNSGLHNCSFHNGFLLISIHRKCDVSVQFLLPSQRITLRDLLMRSPERECMLWTQYFMGVSWIWVRYALLPHKQCDFEVCQLLLGYCLCLQSAVKTVNFERSQAWCPWECEELRYYGSQHLSCQVKNRVRFIPDLFWAILLGLCGKSPLFHIVSLSIISLMLTACYHHICCERTQSCFCSNQSTE